MYCDRNFKTKKELKEAVKTGKEVAFYQPGGMFPTPTNGNITIEGPHGRHKWYAACKAKDGIIVSVK